MIVVLPKVMIKIDTVGDQLILKFGRDRFLALVVLPWLFFFLAGLCFLMAMLPPGAFNQYWLPLGIFFTVITILIVALRESFSDNVYIDRKHRSIFRMLEWKGFSREIFHFSFKDILGMGFNGNWTETKYCSYWSFKVVAVLNNGSLVPLSHEFREAHFRENIEEAKKISQFTDCEFINPDPRLPRLTIEGNGPQKKIVYRTGVKSASAKAPLSAIFLTIFAIAIACDNRSGNNLFLTRSFALGLLILALILWKKNR